MSPLSMSCLRCAHLYRLWRGRGAGHPAPTPGCDAAPRVTLPRCVGLCPGGQVLVHQPAGPRAPSERVSSVSPTETHVKATPAPLRVGGDSAGRAPKAGRGRGWTTPGCDSVPGSVQGAPVIPRSGTRSWRSPQSPRGRTSLTPLRGLQGLYPQPACVRGQRGHPSAGARVQMCADVQTKVE